MSDIMAEAMRTHVTGDAVLLPNSDDFDLTDWEFGFGKLDDDIAEAVAEGLRNTIANDPINVSLPWLWSPEGDGQNGPAVNNPLELDITLPFSQMNGVTFRVSLNDVVADFTETLADGFARQDKATVRRDGLADALRKLADTVAAVEIPE